MSKWLNVETISFPARAVRFHIGRRDAPEKFIQAFEMELEPLELWLRGLVLVHRPELADCSILYMGFEQSNCHWEIVVEHPTLPATPNGCLLPCEPLIPPAISQPWIGADANGIGVVTTQTVNE